MAIVMKIPSGLPFMAKVRVSHHLELVAVDMRSNKRNTIRMVVSIMEMRAINDGVALTRMLGTTAMNSINLQTTNPRRSAEMK